MTRYKRLNILGWFSEKELYEEELRRIQPVFNKPGYYLDRKTKKTWIEDGKEAFAYGNEQVFKSYFETSEIDRPLIAQNEEYKLIETLVKKFKRKELFDIYLSEKHRRELQKIRREVILHMLKD